MSASTTAGATRHHSLPAVVTLGVGILALGGLFWPECQAAVGVWMESTAYGHCFLVLPIALYLLWDRRDALRSFVPQPSVQLALLGLPLPFAWLLAERLGIMEGRQLVAVALLQVLFLSVMGWRMYRAYSGPLLYLFFLVPFGLFLTPILQAFTARFIDVGLNVLAIPHFVTDMTIEISAGTFYVAEACAGLRFLIASIAFGVFFALLNYRSTGRRIGFIVASIVVPIIANGFRALGIVVLGKILGSAEAAAADHLIYGWFFFSFVTLLLVLAGLPFREFPAVLPDADSLAAPSGFMPARVAASAVGLAIVVAAVGPAAALALNHSASTARLGGAPALVAPAGCLLGPVGQPAPDRASATMTCGSREWTVSIRAVPNRSTGAALVEARRDVAGPIDGDDTVVGGLTGLPNWQTAVSQRPGFVVASAAWVDGQPAPGGIRQRLLQARDSLVGAAYDPVVMALTWRSEQTLSEAQIGEALGQIRSFIQAQPDLTATLDRVTAAH